MMGLISIIVVMALLALCFKFAAWALILALKIVYVCCVGLPVAAVLLVIGALLCCTIILIPVGTGMFRLAGGVIWPF